MPIPAPGGPVVRKSPLLRKVQRGFSYISNSVTFTFSVRYLLLFISSFLTLSCGTSSQEPSTEAEPAGPALFTLLSPDDTGVTFANNLDEGPNTNVMMYEYFYNGGGVAVGDLNGDGLDDIYFTGNMVPNRLYINKGNLKFTDATAPAGVAGREGPWTTGVTMADVNGDGRLDLYVCYSGSIRPENRLPELFINDGNDAGGIPHFTNRTAEYGLAHPTQSTQGVFFDYDRDGDLDLFQLNHNPRLLPVLDPAATASLLKKSDPEIGVRLYRNTANRFTDVTEKAGLSSSVLSYGLGVGVSDLNADGWPDLYVSNDYGVPDYLYLNNRNGTFRDAMKTSVGHTSNFSMGNDIADVNNDGRPDIMTLDMLPEDNRRQKLLLAPDNYDKYALSVASGFHHQTMRNMLQINTGDGQFAEMGQLAGVSNTDWSWAPLLADYDNDGWKDLYITNGYVRDYTNMDFLKYMSDFMQNRPTNPSREDVLELVRKMPSSNVANYMFRNQGGVASRAVAPQFTAVGPAWGLRETSNSTGAAYADLDNDGDLDLIVNNTNQPAFVYRNDASDPTVATVKNHFLAVKLAGAGANTQGLGAKLTLYQNGNQQYLEQMPTRGFQSSVSPRLHFGLGPNARIDSLRIVWPTGKTQLLTRIPADQLLTLREADARQTYRQPTPVSALFRETKSPIAFTDPTVTTNDFKRQPLMVNAQSFGGPCMTKADVNGDGIDDLFVGGAPGRPQPCFWGRKQADSAENPSPLLIWTKHVPMPMPYFLTPTAIRFPIYTCAAVATAIFSPETSPVDRLLCRTGCI